MVKGDFLWFVKESLYYLRSRPHPLHGLPRPYRITSSLVPSVVSDDSSTVFLSPRLNFSKGDLFTFSLLFYGLLHYTEDHIFVP